MRKQVRTLVTVIAAGAMFALAGCASSGSTGAASTSGSGLKTAFVYVSPLKGSLWTQAWDASRKKLAADGANTSIVEPIPETADVVGVFNDLIGKGNKLIYATAFGYQPFVLDVATKNPTVDFVVIGPWVQAKPRPANVTAASSDNWIARYALGQLAAQTTKSNTLGFVAANPIPTVIASINAFELGAKSVKPDVKTHVVFTGTWFDPARATQAAQGLAQGGADVIAQYEDSVGTLLGAEKAGVWGIGSESDGSALTQKYLSGSVNNWDTFAKSIYDSALAGSFKGADDYATISSGGVTVGPINAAVDAATQTAVAATMTKLGTGEIVPFTGPISSNAGKVVVPAGQSWKDSGTVFKNQNFLVDGVVGNIPN